MMDAQLLLDRLAQERKLRAAYREEFSALYDAVEFLLRQRVAISTSLPWDAAGVCNDPGELA